MVKNGIFLAILVLLSGARAQSVILNVNLKNGTTASFSVAEIKKITFSGMTNIDPKDLKRIEGVIKTLKLFQNHPNPFNPTTCIEYDLAKSGGVEVKIYNVTGQLIRTFSQTCQAPGVYKVTWDGKNERGRPVSSGLYIYEVKFDDSVYQKKMMLLK